MSITSNDEKGSALIVLLGICVIVAACIVGLIIYKHHQDTPKPSVSSRISSLPNTNTKTSTTSQTNDPTAGWKAYCDTTANNCFKYPSDWALSVSTQDGVNASVRNPSNTVLISYSSPFIKDSGVATFYTQDIENIEGSVTNLKVVGGAFTANNLPSYFIVDSSLLNTYPLSVGQNSNFQTAARFTNKNSSANSQLTAYPIGQSFTTTSQVQAWFGTTDAKTSLLILKSFTY